MLAKLGWVTFSLLSTFECGVQESKFKMAWKIMTKYGKPCKGRGTELEELDSVVARLGEVSITRIVLDIHLIASPELYLILPFACPQSITL